MHTLLLPVSLVARMLGGGDCIAPPAAQVTAVESILTATNSGRPGSIAAAVAASWSGADTSAAVRAQALSQLGVEHWKSRGWRIHGVCVASPTTVFALGENTISLERDSLNFRFDTAGRTQSLLVYTGVDVPIDPRDTSSDVARARALARYLDRLRNAGLFSGSVLVKRGTTTLFADSAGVELRPGGRPIGLDSRINIASSGKLFTATSIMQLVSSGVISLDDTLGKFYADSELSAPVRSVRLRYILAHTSGITDRRDTLASKPGERFVYSNLEFVILGDVLERASGERWEDYFAEHIFRPAGMTRTGRAVLTRPVNYLAMGYIPQFSDTGLVLAANPLLHIWPGNTAGALFSTTNDLARFAEAWRAGVLLPRRWVDSMRTLHNTTKGSEYGYGVMLWRAPRIWGHAGDLPGTDADVEIIEPSGVISVVLSNMSGVNNPVRRRIARLWGVVAR